MVSLATLVSKNLCATSFKQHWQNDAKFVQKITWSNISWPSNKPTISSDHPGYHIELTMLHAGSMQQSSLLAGPSKDGIVVFLIVFVQWTPIILWLHECASTLRLLFLSLACGQYRTSSLSFWDVRWREGHYVDYVQDSECGLSCHFHTWWRM